MAFIQFGNDELGVEEDFDYDGKLCFLAGISGEANLTKEEVARLHAYLTGLLIRYEGVVMPNTKGGNQ